MKRINCYIPIKLRMTGRLSEAQLEQLGESLVRTLGRAFAHTRRMLPATDMLGSGVVLGRPELVKGNLAPEERAALLNLLGRAIEQAARNQALPVTVTPQADYFPGGATPTIATIPLSHAVFEPFDLARFDATSGTYLLASYQKGKTRVPVALGRNPFAKPSAAQMRAAARAVKPPAPIDWDAVWKALHDPDPLNRFDAFAKIRGLVEAGDKQAVTYALSAIRADGGTPTTDILTALRALATRHPARFRQVLRAIRVDQRASFGGQEVTRNPDDYRLDRGYFWRLDVLGGLARVLSDIPAAQTLGLELEGETTGLARVNGLIVAVIEARRALEAYLIEPRPTTTAQLLAHAFKEGVVPDVPEQTDPAVVGQIRNITNRLPRYIGLVLAGLNDPESVYDLQNDLVEHHRWITDTLVGVQRIDWSLYMCRLLYGDAMGQTEEVKALREARSCYLTAIAEHPFPVADRIAQLRRDTDAFAADWSGRAASAKLGHWTGLAAEIAKVAKSLKSLDLVVPDSYNRRLMETLGVFASLQRQLAAVSAVPRGPELLAQMREIEIDPEFALLAIRVNFCLLWYAAHDLMRVFTDKSIGNDDDRANWRKMLGMICKQIEEQFDKPNMWRLQDILKSWQESIEGYQRNVQRTAENEAWIKVGVILLVIVVTMGVGAPEGVGVIVVTLGEAAIITAASLAVDVALDKPISLGGAAFEFGQNAILGGALKILNAGLFAIALRYPGETLKRLAIIFGGNFVATTLSGLLVQTIQSGAWPEHLGLFLTGCFVLNAIVGVLTGPKIINALNAADRALQAELLVLGNRLMAQHRAWLLEQDGIAIHGTLSKSQHTAFKERGVQIFGDLKRWCDVMKKLPDAVLKNMGITREALDDFAQTAENAAIQINAHQYDLQPGVKRLPAPSDVVLEGGLVPTSGNTIEYNPNFAGSEPAALVRRFRHAGYIVEENAGVLRLLLPGETNPRHLLLPARSDLPAPALRRLVGSPNSNAARGLRALQAQNAVPPLEAMLTRIAAIDSGAVTRVLEGMGRHINWRQIDASAVLAIKGMAHFLDIGGQPSALAVALGLGRRFGTPTALTAVGQFTELLPADLRGIDAIIRTLGHGDRATDAIIGIGRHFVPSRGVYGALGDLAPYVEGGLDDVLRYMVSQESNLNQAALGSLLAARRLLAEHPGARLRFELEVRRGETLFRVQDIHVTLPSTDPLGFISAEVKAVHDIRILRLGRSVQQFARDVDEALANPPPVSFRPLARLRWLVQTPSGAPAELRAARDEVKQILRRAFDENYDLKNHPQRDAALRDFDEHFDEIMQFF